MFFLLSCTPPDAKTATPICENPADQVHYDEVSAAWGLVDTTAPEVQLDVSGGPVAMGDLDEDGDDDLVVGLRTGGFQIHWNEGDHFTVIQVLNGLEGSSIAMADLNGDRHLDLLLGGSYIHRGETLYELKGDGKRGFSAPDHLSIPMFFGDIRTIDLADVDHDGDLDLLVANTRSDVFALNEGDGTFINHSADLGMLRDASVLWLGAFLDLDEDLWSDLFLDVDLQDRGNVSRMYHNAGGEFSEIPAFSTVNSMGGSVVSTENDSFPDVFVTGTGGDGLYQNLGDDTFVDVSLSTAAKGRNTIGQMSMGSLGLDTDNDGWMDIVTVAGRYATEPEIWPSLDVSEPDQLLRNTNGMYQDVSAAVGFGSEADSHAVAWGMLDDDGTPDLVISNIGKPSRLYRSVCSANRSLDFDLVGRRSNSFGIGARVEVETDIGRIVRWNAVLGGLGASQPPRVHVGVGEAVVQAITVYWPSGVVQEVPVQQEGRVRVEEE